MIAQRRARAAVRNWFEEFDELAAKGFMWRSDHDFSQLRTRACTRCGEDMEVRLFERRDVSTASTRCASCAAGGSNSDPQHASLRLGRTSDGPARVLDRLLGYAKL